MTSLRTALHNIFVWTFERGTLQYDIICALILAFIFFVPRGCFISKKTAELAPSYQNTSFASQKQTALEQK
jgi:hypothetical protein